MKIRWEAEEDIEGLCDQRRAVCEGRQAHKWSKVTLHWLSGLGVVAWYLAIMKINERTLLVVSDCPTLCLKHKTPSFISIYAPTKTCTQG